MSLLRFYYEAMEEIIKKFWKKEASEKEQIELLQQLNKENPELYEKLKKQFELRLYNANQTESVKEEKFEKILKELHQKIKISQTHKTKWLPSRFYKVAAMVAFLLMAAGVFYLTIPGSSKPADKDSNNIAVIENPHDNKIMSLVLTDGSTVKLYPNSAINYAVSFGVDNRSISLTGKAFFKVAKNKKLPFVVEANHYTTTALGTEFTVDSYSEEIKIHLYEGKVVIQSISPTHQFDPVYLQPGQGFGINKNSGEKILYDKKQSVKPEMISNKVKLISINSDETADEILKFRKENLKKVWDTLSEKYGKTIKYDNEEIEGLTFTGEISLADPLNEPVSRLCYLNELKFTEKGDEIIIHK